ncbi:MAG: MFS transporter [Paenibacillaceae bacterium]|nr:MFS transporter [Paenibacillaceae bacterium]
MAKTTKRGIVSAGLMAAMFIGALDVTVVSTALPHITKELGGLSLISWVFSIYTLTTCVATPVFGKLTDLFGRRIVFAIGLALFVLGSVLCGAATSMVALIVFRAVQGIGAGALNPVVFTIVGDMYPGEQRARMQGVFASVWSIAGLLGPLVGGYFVDYVTWRWIFYMNIPIGIVSFLLVFLFLHERFEKKQKRIDYAGAAAFSVAITALLFALVNGGEKYAWGSATIVGLFAATAVFLIAFYWIEKRAQEPMIPLSLFRLRIMNVSNIGGFLSFAVTAGMTIYPPIWIQSLLGHSATSSGLTTMPMTLAWPLAANIAGRWMYRMGTKATVVIGSCVVVAGCAWLMAVELSSPYWYLIGILIVVGFGMGFITTPATVLIQSAVGWQMRGVATSTNSLMRSLGQTVGIAVFGTVFNHYAVTGENAGLAAGMHAIFVIMFAVAIVNLFVMAWLPSHRQVMEQQKAAS